MEVEARVPDAKDPNTELSRDELTHEGSTSLATGQAVVETVEGELEGKPAAIAGRTPWQLARARLRRDRPTMVMLFIVGFALLLGIVAPILSKVGVLQPTAFNADLIDPSTGGLPKGPWGGMSWSHPFGIEPGSGRDLLSRVVLGVTFSLMIAFLATVVAVTLGTVMGLVSGFFGGKVDFWISRLVDMILSFPVTLMLLALSGSFIKLLEKVLPEGNASAAAYIILVLGFFGWPYFSRIIRGQVLSMREREFVEAAKSLGARGNRILFKELLPNLWAPVLIYFTLLMPTNISAEAALSYLGVGVKAPTPTLGNILTDSVSYASGDFVFFAIPALFIATLVLSFNLLGDGLRDALDPKADR